MILMIRINLLPPKDRKRRRSVSGASIGGQKLTALLMALLLVEFLALFTWQQDLDAVAANQNVVAKRAEDKVKALEKKKETLEKREQAKLELARQNVIFERMKAQKTGPPEMLKFISYVLTKKEDNLYNREELKAQEAAGWSSSWSPENVWITELEEKADAFVIKGHARSHEDVAEFYRRIETGIYFVLLDPIMQQVIPDKDFAELEVVEFEAKAMLNYDSTGELKMRREFVPERLAHLIATSKEEPKDKAEDKGKKGKGAK